jgi:hypothetical protein
MILTKKLSINDTQILFDIDCLLKPLMVYQNSIEYIKNSEDTKKKKLTCYKNILESLCIQDTIQTNIFEVQDWDELYDYSCIYGCTIPNYYFNQLKYKNKDIDIQFTNLLNKISQMYVNKKLLNSAKFSIGKLNYDNDEIIYLTEIMSYYFNNYKNIVNENEESEDEEEDDNIIIQPIKKILKNDNSELILFMNKYNIDIDGLENLLKIEKLNQINEKRKKKFTLKIKKEINCYLINQNYSSI